MPEPCAQITTVAGCEGSARGLLPADPFTALNVAYGMLLGVDDFQLLGANPRGKGRLHAAWLHGAGVIWGLAVHAALAAGELRVAPGLGVTDAGQDVRVEVQQCLSIGDWWDRHGAEPEAQEAMELDGDAVVFDAHVVLIPRVCLTRPVPAFVDPCEGAERDTACSRTVEIAEVLLRPGCAPAREPRYPRVQALLAAAGDGPTAGLHEAATLDAIDLAPDPGPGEPALFPAPSDAPLVLADIRGIRLEGSEGEWSVAAGRVDYGPRPTHIATSTLQDLLGARVVADAGGPRVLPDCVTLTGARATLEFDRPVAPETVAPWAFQVTSLTTGGWTEATVTGAGLDDSATRATLDLQTSPAGLPVRLLARGTGATPILGADAAAPLAGAVGGPPTSGDDGRDYVHMFR